MPLLIDGYNLLNATGIVGRGGPSSLGRSRLALLNFLAAAIDPREVAHTTVVFDAHDPPPGLPRVVQHGPLLVRFAAKNRTADELIEELIVADSAPRRLVVVSSDHEIQRAARRRRAKAVGSEAWYSDLIRQRREARRGIGRRPRPARRAAVGRRRQLLAAAIRRRVGVDGVAHGNRGRGDVENAARNLGSNESRRPFPRQSLPARLRRGSLARDVTSHRPM